MPRPCGLANGWRISCMRGLGGAHYNTFIARQLRGGPQLAGVSDVGDGGIRAFTHVHLPHGCRIAQEALFAPTPSADETARLSPGLEPGQPAWHEAVLLPLPLKLGWANEHMPIMQ